MASYLAKLAGNSTNQLFCGTDLSPRFPLQICDQILFLMRAVIAKITPIQRSLSGELWLRCIPYNCQTSKRILPGMLLCPLQSLRWVGRPKTKHVTNWYPISRKLKSSPGNQVEKTSHVSATYLYFIRCMSVQLRSILLSSPLAITLRNCLSSVTMFNCCIMVLK